MTADVHRYFMGLAGFAFVICWATAGFLVAIGGLAVFGAIVVGPQLAGRRRRHTKTPRRVRSRPITAESRDTYDLVPDDPSLVFEFS